LTGGVFSYDGVHPTQFGYSYVALKFIQAINAKFGNHFELPNLRSSMAGSGGGQLVSLDLSSLYVSPQADANMRWALNVPTDAQISQYGRGQTPRHRRHH